MRTGLLAFILLPVLLFTTCTEKQEKKPDPMATVDTLQLKPGGKLELQRYHTFLAKEPDIYGHLPRTLSFSDTGHCTYTIDSGSLVYTPKYFTAHCFVHQLKPDSFSVHGRVPAFLDTGAQPVQIEYMGNFFPGKRPSASCYLLLNDTSVLLNNAENRIQVHQDLVRELTTTAYVDGLKWPIFKTLIAGKSVKDSVCLDIHVRFETRHPKK